MLVYTAEKPHAKQRMYSPCVISLGFGFIFVSTGQSQDFVIENWFSKLEAGDFILGELFQKKVAKTSLQCAMR